MGSFRGVIYFAALILFCSSASAAVTVEAVRVGSVYSGPSNQKLVDATLKTVSGTPGVPVKYVSRPVAVSAASAARLARGALGGPLGLAVTAAMLAEGLLIDNDTGEIVVPGEMFDPGEYPTVYCLSTGCAVTRAGVCEVAHVIPIEFEATCPRPYTLLNNMFCRGTRVDNGNPCGPSGSISAHSNSGQANRPAIPASEVQVEGAISDGLLRDLINDMIQRRPSQIPTILPELASEMDATRDAQEAAESHSSDPGANPAPTPEQQEIVDNQTTTAPTMASEWPTFCSWATIVCDFIDWMRAEPELPEHPPLPLLDIDIPDYDSNLPSTVQCPAPVVVNTQMWGTFELSYQPFCDLADYIRYGVLGIAYLFAAYTIMGVRR